MGNSIAEQFDDVTSKFKQLIMEESIVRQRKNEQTEKRFDLCKKIISAIKEIGNNKTFVLFKNNEPELIVDIDCALMPFRDVPDECCPENIIIGYYKTYECDAWIRRDEIVDVMVAYPRTWFESDSWVKKYKAVFDFLTSKEEAKKENKREQKELK